MVVLGGGVVSYERGTPVTRKRTPNPTTGRGGAAAGDLHGAEGPLQRLLGHNRGTPLRPCRRPMPRVLRGSQGGGRFLVSKAPLEAKVDHWSNDKVVKCVPRGVPRHASGSPGGSWACYERGTGVNHS